MENLAKDISAQVAIFLQATRRLKSDEPTFEHGTSDALRNDAEASEARMRLLGLTDELHALLCDAEELFASQTNPAITSNAICQLGLADAMPVDSPGSTIEDMATKAELPVPLARRLMRHAVSNWVFSEPRAGFFTHTFASKALVADTDVRGWIRSGMEDVVPASYEVRKSISRVIIAEARWSRLILEQIPRAVKKWGASGAPNHSGWNILHNKPRSVFEELDSDPERASNFAATMRYFSKKSQFALPNLSSGFDWQQLSGKILTDVGGSTGHVSAFLAAKIPNLRCIVQDRGAVVANGVQAEGIEFEEHDFFRDQTRKSDAFFLRFILHDWADEYARRILTALRPGMKSGTKILIQDMILPSGGSSMSRYRQRILRTFDINMLGLQNGQERDIDDWKTLFAETDSRFEFTAVHQDPANAVGLLEYTWRGT